MNERDNSRDARLADSEHDIRRDSAVVTDGPPPRRTPAHDHDEHSPLFDDGEGRGLRDRWEAIQTGFVDEPRAAVEQADALVSQVLGRLTEVFTRERTSLEEQWTRGGDVSTEDLRLALKRYRSFFERLLSV
jgi:hypothetical protein